MRKSDTLSLTDSKKKKISLRLLSDTENNISTDETLINLLAEKRTMKILSILQNKPKTVSEISEECKFSVNLIYSRIRALDNLKLVYVSGQTNEDWKKKFRYQSKIKSFDLIFENGKTSLKISYNKKFQKK